MARSGWLFFALFPCLACAQVVGVALDAKAELVDGDLHVLASPPPDSVVFYRFEGDELRLLGRVLAPASFQGPPSGVAIPADGRLALVSTSRRIDPADPKALVPDHRLSLVDLGARPVRIVQTLSLDASPSAVAVDRAGRFALVTHPEDDSVSVVALAGGRATIREKVSLGEGSAPAAAAIAPDGRHALVTLSGRNRIGFFGVEEGRLKVPALYEISAGVYPAAVAYCGSSGFAVVANYGRVTGDADTVSLIDVDAAQPRVVDTVTVGPSPEGVACSADGRYVAAAVQNMSTVPASHPLYHRQSRVVLLRIVGGRLQRVAEAPIGGWAQGVGFLGGSRELFAESMMDRSLNRFGIRDDRLVEIKPTIRFSDGAPAAAGVAGR